MRFCIKCNILTYYIYIQYIYTSIFTQYHAERKILNNVRIVLFKVTISLGFTAHDSIRNLNHPEQQEVIGWCVSTTALHLCRSMCTKAISSGHSYHRLTRTKLCLWLDPKTDRTSQSWMNFCRCYLHSLHMFFISLSSCQEILSSRKV